MLEQFCYDHHFDIVDFYIDDGYSGLSFQRPAFQRLLEDIDNGLIDIVITKDLSRLGRDYIMTGYYTDIYFDRMNVRYIAINDDIDTFRGDNDIAPFKNILNDMYAKDISRKIKSAKRQRALKGYYISGQPPYGYRVDPENHHHLVIDENVADVVRMIFQLASGGMTAEKIAAQLTGKQIIPPSAYKVQMGDTRFTQYADKKEWTQVTVNQILHNRVYEGTMVNHKSEVVNYKTKAHRSIPEKEQIIMENTHEAIISPELWEKVQDQLKKRAKVRKHQFDNWFANKVFCSECGSALTVNTKKSGNHEIHILRCWNHFEHPERCRHHHAIRYDRLIAKVQDDYGDQIGDGSVRDFILRKIERVEVGYLQHSDDGNIQKISIILKAQKKVLRSNRYNMFTDWFYD